MTFAYNGFKYCVQLRPFDTVEQQSPRNPIFARVLRLPKHPHNSSKCPKRSICSLLYIEDDINFSGFEATSASIVRAGSAEFMNNIMENVRAGSAEFMNNIMENVAVCHMAVLQPSSHTQRHAWLDPDFLMTE